MSRTSPPAENKRLQQETKSAQEVVEVQLLPGSFKNEMFENNLQYFKLNQPSIYNSVTKHECTKYSICQNPDGSPNILNLSSNRPLYPFFTAEEMNQFFQDEVNKIAPSVHFDHTFFPDAPDQWKKNNPIQYSLFEELYTSGPFKTLGLAGSDLSGLTNFTSHYLPLLRVYGIGLGHHLTKLIQTRNISLISIYEPEKDLFYTSLFVIPWHLIFKYFQLPNKRLNLVIGSSHEEAIEKNSTFYLNQFLPTVTGSYRYKHIASPEIEKLINKEQHAEAILKEKFDAGWYEDQRSGLYLAARNIRKRNKVYTGRSVNNGFRAFIIGSGPSLNEAIEYIKIHKDDALIFSCGTAISPLLSNGIIPDFEIVQERNWHIPQYESLHAPDEVSRIALLKLNVVSTQIDHHYKDVFVVQKYNDPGTSLLDENYAITTAVNPTVTNAGVSIAAALGAKEVYLFGVDYGAPVDSEKMHASNTVYDKEDDSVRSKTEFELPGNFGERILTDRILSWSKETTEGKIAEYPKIKWINVGEGALINGTTPSRIEDLPNVFHHKINKAEIYETITTTFNNTYSPEIVLDLLKNEKMKQVDGYLDAVLQFATATPKNQEEINGVLALLYHAIRTGVGDSFFLPTTLFSTGFTKFVTNVYLQNLLAEDDQSATTFFEKGMRIFTSHVESIRKDMQLILEYIEKDEETEFFIVYE